MKNVWTWFLLAVSLLAPSHQSAPTSSNDSGAMFAAVSANARMPGIGSGKVVGKGAAFVEPFARLTPSGEWQSLACFADRDGKHYDENQRSACLKFEKEYEKEYLNKPHTYTVVSAEGRGATISTPQTTLDDCFGYTVKGTYTGAGIVASAIAAASTDFFSDGPAPQIRM